MRQRTSVSQFSRIAVLVGVLVIGLVGANAATAAGHDDLERIGYCIDGEFFNLVRGQPSADPQYDGWEYAWYVEGKGLTCDPPPAGWVATTTAPDEYGIPGKTYPWFRPPGA